MARYYWILSYFILIVIIIPFIIYKQKYYTFLCCYMPNVDLIANILTWWGGPHGIFSRLYLQLPISIQSLFSQTAINYIALLGMTFIIIKNSFDNKNIYIGWGMAFIMILMTYLYTRFVNYIMNRK